MIFKIKDFLTRIRVPVQVEDDASYQLVTIRMRHQGVCLRGVKAGREIGTKTMYRVKAGQFVLSGIDARNGAFGVIPDELEGAVVTNDFWYFDVDDRVIDRDYFLYLTSTPFFDNLCRLASDGTTNRVRLQADKFYNYEITLPPVDEQRIVLKRLVALKSKLTALNAEFDQQDTLLTKLQQAILQDAVRGKLTATYRESVYNATSVTQPVTGSSPVRTATEQTETGTDLLARIRAEKAELIHSGKLRSQKTLPPITDAEKPFELPEGWVWARLGDLAEMMGGGTPSKNNPTYWQGNLPWVSPKDMKVDYLSDTIDHISEVAIQESTAKIIPAESLLIVVRGMILLKKIPLAINVVPVTLNQDMKAIKPFKKAVLPYLFICLKGLEPMLLREVNTATHGTGKIDSEILTNLHIPLPPLAEQRAIVAAVERALGQVAQLRAELQAQRAGAGELLRALLHRAFAGGEEVET
ncbi:restriction endonuclease subunit S [Spirosoma montaniterrae]|uniref:Type I restriction modification DNA specificity domain-containing protein n=1 Tax=Spirosoma montaniterrae TaxID=1178516 RepID=A0A1P9X1T1_9BACT|nr:restriction endonuclease subunit S [Spirosoma montaniterrae]AQG81570.1 hypothetical protein AWR27_21005 [Spirosoma montaniterrae]